MNYKQIKESAQGYADRYDAELVNAIPGFTKLEKQVAELQKKAKEKPVEKV